MKETTVNVKTFFALQPLGRRVKYLARRGYHYWAEDVTQPDVIRIDPNKTKHNAFDIVWYGRRDRAPYRLIPIEIKIEITITKDNN